MIPLAASDALAISIYAAIVIGPLLISALIARSLARPSGRTTLGFWLGLFLGPMGILIAAVLGLQRPPLRPAPRPPFKSPPPRRPIIIRK